MTDTADTSRTYALGQPADDLARARTLRDHLPTSDPAAASCLHQFPTGERCAREHGHAQHGQPQHVAVRKLPDGWVTSQISRPAGRRPTTDPATDLRTTLMPSDTQLGMAAALHFTNPGAEAVIVGLVLPGKTRGVWTTGQHVQDAPGAFLAQSSHPSRDDVAHGYGAARAAAVVVAQAALGDRTGTTAYVVIRPDGTWAAFEM